MNDDQQLLTQEPQEEDVSNIGSDVTQDPPENKTPTDLLVQLHQAGDSRAEPDNEDG